ncbi:MAG: Uma2 family endonuclease [Myxococcota bacterium]
MSTAPRLHRHTYREYAGALEISNLKLEYWAGEILAMASGTREHSALASRVVSLLDAKLPAGCRTFNSDLLLKIGDVTVFPDGQVVCGKVERVTVGNRTAILNPGLVIEVTSPSTGTTTGVPSSRCTRRSSRFRRCGSCRTSGLG